jgi:hypothetical protein
MNNVATPFKTRLLIGFLAGITLLGGGCSIFESEPESESESVDVCADSFNRFITQHSNGLGITSDECVDSSRGEWIDGGCYCHGAGE